MAVNLSSSTFQACRREELWVTCNNPYVFNFQKCILMFHRRTSVALKTNCISIITKTTAASSLWLLELHLTSDTSEWQLNSAHLLCLCESEVSFKKRAQNGEIATDGRKEQCDSCLVPSCFPEPRYGARLGVPMRLLINFLSLVRSAWLSD